MRKLIQTLLAAALAVTAFSAPAADKVDTSKRLTVGFPQIDENQPWRTAESVFEGEQAAKWLAKATNGKANIVELQGSTGAAPAIDRKKGFEKGISAHPGMKIVKSQDGNWTPAGGKELMEAFLKAEGKNINAVFAHNDGMALGAIQAIEEAGLKPGKDIVIVSIDGIKEAFQAMMEGKLNCTVECTPLLGAPAYKALRRHLAGEKLPKWIKSEDQTFPAEVAKDVIATRKY